MKIIFRWLDGWMVVANSKLAFFLVFRMKLASMRNSDNVYLILWSINGLEHNYILLHSEIVFL